MNFKLTIFLVTICDIVTALSFDENKIFEYFFCFNFIFKCHLSSDH